MAKNRGEKPPTGDKTNELESVKKDDQVHASTAPTEQISEVRDAIVSTTTEARQGNVEKKYYNLYGDMDVEAIIDKEHYKRIITQIKERLLQDLSDCEDKRNNLSFSDFKREIRDKYSGDEEMLRFLDQQFAKIESDYEREIAKYEEASKKMFEAAEENKKTPKNAAAYLASKKYNDDMAEKLRTGDPWDTVKLSTSVNHYYKEGEERFLSGPADSLYYITSFLKGSALDNQDIFKDVKKTLKGKKILVLGDDIGTLSGILRQYGAESYGLEVDEFKVAIAHSGILAKEDEPQNKVHEGDIGDLLTTKDTELLETLKSIGPFDMVFSYRVFNAGSGIEKVTPFDLADKAWRGRPFISDTETVQLTDFQTLMKRKFDSLLNENGLQLHVGTDEYFQYLFPRKYRDRAGIFNRVTTQGNETEGTVLIPKTEINSQI